MSVDQLMRRTIEASAHNLVVQPFAGWTEVTVLRGESPVVTLYLHQTAAVGLSCALMDAVNLRAANGLRDA